MKVKKITLNSGDVVYVTEAVDLPKLQMRYVSLVEIMDMPLAEYAEVRLTLDRHRFFDGLDPIM